MRAIPQAILAGVTLLGSLVLVTGLRANQAEDEATIRANAAKYVESYNRRDSKTMSSMWSPDAVYTDESTGESAVGRDAIKKQLDNTFAGAEDAKLKIKIDSIDFVSPNVAVEKGAAEVSYAKHPTENSEYTAVHVRRDGQWLLDRVTDVDDDDNDKKPPEPPPSNFEHLKELDWMVGSWVDKDDADDITIQTDCEWTKNRNFMTRSFAVAMGDRVSKSGMQIVGWDPINKKIHSWVFDSDGGYSEGDWTRKDKKWVIKQHGTLPDGGKTSATNILTEIDNDSYSWESIHRDIDGEMQPNVEEVLIVRKTE
ncbi:MAG TPA: nuclear transport factor 2 family protein [Lacipirellulaceae bacterium]|jgi:uncharacterized protein (TIGR02246 family)|nr:nuclear transport factor 2 family protein [Lacipirellulaceae bacterium]